MNLCFRRKHVPLLATIAVWTGLYLVAAIRFPGFLSANVFLNLFYDNCFLGICAIGMTFVILSGGLDLSVGSVVGCTSIAIAILIRDWHMPPALAVAILLVFGIIYGMIVGSLIHFFKLPPFMVTLAGMFFARGLGFVISVNSIPINVPLYNHLANFAIPLFDGYLTVVALIFLGVAATGVWAAGHTRFGRAVYAIGGSTFSAELMGLDIGKTKIGVYAISGFCATLAGAVYSLYTFSGNAWAGNGLEMDAIAAVVIGGTLLSGGVGYVFGTVFGVMILGIIQTYISFDGTLSSWWTKIVIGLLLCIFILLQRFLTQASGLPPRSVKVSWKAVWKAKET